MSKVVMFNVKHVNHTGTVRTPIPNINKSISYECYEAYCLDTVETSFIKFKIASEKVEMNNELKTLSKTGDIFTIKASWSYDLKDNVSGNVFVLDRVSDIFTNLDMTKDLFMKKDIDDKEKALLIKGKLITNSNFFSKFYSLETGMSITSIENHFSDGDCFVTGLSFLQYYFECQFLRKSEYESFVNKFDLNKCARFIYQNDTGYEFHGIYFPERKYVVTCTKLPKEFSVADNHYDNLTAFGFTNKHENYFVNNKLKINTEILNETQTISNLGVNWFLMKVFAENDVDTDEYTQAVYTFSKMLTGK